MPQICFAEKPMKKEHIGVLLFKLFTVLFLSKAYVPERKKNLNRMQKFCEIPILTQKKTLLFKYVFVWTGGTDNI